MKKTYYQECVDHETGEIVSSISQYEQVSSNGKYFLGSFDTKWYKGLKGSEVLTMIALLSVENNKTNEVYLTKHVKVQLCADIEICLDQFEKNIRSLIEKDMLKRISRGVYVLNPETLWIGSSKTKTKKINVYNNVQNS